MEVCVPVEEALLDIGIIVIGAIKVEICMECGSKASGISSLVEV